MKHFLVSDDVGNPIYFDHPDGRMHVLPIATTLDVMSHNFSDCFSSMKAGNMIFVFHRYEDLCFTVLSDEGESEIFLRSQLRLLHDILLLLFGPRIHNSKKAINFLKHQKLLQKLIGTMCWMGSKYQSFLVESIENVEVNDKLRSNWVDTLKKIFDTAPKAMHAYIFVGSKLLASYSKPKAPEVTTSDLYLLIIYFMGQFHPQVNQIEETALPVADYTDHSRINQTPQIPQEEEDPSQVNSVDEGFTSANEEWDIDDFKTDQESEQLLFLNPDFNGYFEEISKEYEADGEEPEKLKSSLHNFILFMLYHLGDGTIFTFTAKIRHLRDMILHGLASESAIQVQILQVLLNASGSCEAQSVDGAFTDKVGQCVAKFQETHNLPVTGTADKQTIRSLVLVVARAQPVDPPSPFFKKTHTVNTNSTTGTPRTPYSEMKGHSTPHQWRQKEDWDGTDSPAEPSENQSSSPSPSSSPYKTYGTSELLNTSDASNVVLSLSTTSMLGTSMLGLSLNDETNASGVDDQNQSHEEPPPPPAEPVYSQLFLRTSGSYAPYWVYSAEIESSVTLVVVNKNQTGSNEEKNHFNALLHNLRHSMKNYIDYLIIKERTHISVLSYVHQLPGLIHFIYVDRTNNRVIAPIIGPLHGQQYEQNDETTKHMIALLTKKVWEMCYSAQKHLSMGYCSMLMKSGDFQYSYRLWLEDNDATEVPFDQDILPTPPPTTASQSGNPPPPNGNFPFSIGHPFYKELIKKTPRATKCYELYSLHLGILSVNIVASHERKLLNMLNPNRKFS